MTRRAHPVPLEVREKRVRELLERLAEAVARAGFGEVADTTFLAPEVAERLHSLAAAYRDFGDRGRTRVRRRGPGGGPLPRRAVGARRGGAHRP